MIADCAIGKGRSEALGRGAFIELPVVVQLLQAMSMGDASIDEVREVLEDVAQDVAPEPGLMGGCCSMCAYSYDSYLKVWDNFDRHFAQQELLEEARTNFDIVVTKNRIHAADCGSARIHLPSPPMRLEDFTHGGYVGDRPGPYALLAYEELDEWLARNTAKSGRRKFCKRCVARIPGAIEKFAKADPICWEWPVRSLENLDPESYEGFKIMEEWQNGRCAACGIYADLVLDHDHETGLVRGWLCRSCNVREGSRHDTSAMISNYRKKNPATILGIRIPFYVVKDHQLREGK